MFLPNPISYTEKWGFDFKRTGFFNYFAYRGVLEMEKMNKALLIILLLIFCVAITTVSIAQEASATINRIYLKDGTVIECDMGWIEGDTLYYQKYGGTIGISLKTVDIDRTYKKNKHNGRVDADELDIFNLDVGNVWTYQGSQQQGSSYTLETKVLTLDQTTFPATTYIIEEKKNGSFKARGWYEKTFGELKLWGVKGGEGDEIYTNKFSAGLVQVWYPMEVNDHKESSAKLEVVELPGYVLDISLTVDVLSKEPVALSFGTFRAYKLCYQLRMWGYDEDETSTFYWWVVPYLGGVKYESDESQEELTSFAIGGGIITQETEQAEEETERGTIIRGVDEEAQRNISVSRPSDTPKKKTWREWEEGKEATSFTWPWNKITRQEWQARKKTNKEIRKIFEQHLPLRVKGDDLKRRFAPSPIDELEDKIEELEYRIEELEDE